MKKYIILTISILLIFSCEEVGEETSLDSDNEIDSNETINNETEVVSSGTDIYVAGWVETSSESQVACYWKNGVRFDLGPGEVTDIIVEDGKVYCVGYSYGGDATYWIDNEVFKLEGTGDEEAYAITVHDGDVYTAGRDNGACYWKNTKKTKLNGGDSSGYGIAVKENGNVFVGGYYLNNHHYVIPAVWKNGNRVNLSVPQHGDGEVQDVKISDSGTVFYFGWTMKPDNMLGYVPKAAYWEGSKRKDLPNGGGANQDIYGGEGYGGYLDGPDIYVAGKIDHIALWDDDTEDNTKPGTGGTYAHYWKNGKKFDLPGGVYNNFWVSNAYDVSTIGDTVVVAGDVATETQTQVPALWINNELILLEGDKSFGVATAVYIDK